MAHDLAVLPAFIAEPGALIITDSDLDSEWLEHLNDTFGLDVHAVKRNELRHMSDYRIMPWGWCLDMRRRLIKWGASRDSLPTKDEIYHLRGLSHRRVSTLIHLRLQELLGQQLCPMPVELATTSEVMAFVKKHRECYIKTPWSSSGRGIYHTIDGATPELEQWCRGALKRQGSVMCEVALNKTMDFAVEYHCSDGKAMMRGYSVFETDSHSQYSQGEVAPTDVLKQKITAQYPHLDEVVTALTQTLNELVAPHHTGWMGVDMILFNAECIMHNAQSQINAQCYNNAQCTMHNAQSQINAQSAPLTSSHSTLTSQHSPLTSSNYTLSSPLSTLNSPLPHLSSQLKTGLNPCIELNLRPTMGAITSVLGDRIIAPDTTARFVIEQRSSTSDKWSDLPEPVLKEGRLSSGAFVLTPPSPTALYRAVLRSCE